MTEGLGFGRRSLVSSIVEKNWEIANAHHKTFTYNELLFVIQELFTEEGKAYFHPKSSKRGHHIFREFVKLLLYRNLANYDSMLLITSEKGCLTDDTLIEMPRDLKKYPKGIPIKKLIGKKDFYVYSFNIQTKKLELKKAQSCEFAKCADVYELELVNGMKIKATGDHPFLLMDGSYKKLEDIFYKNPKGNSVPWMNTKNGRLKTDRLRIFSRPFIFDGNDNRIKIDYLKIDRKNRDTSLKHSEIEHRFIMKELGYNIDEKIIHHKNKKNYDNNIYNLCLLSNQNEHYNEHNMKEYQFKKGNKFCYNIGYSTYKKEKIKNGSKEFVKQCSKKRKIFCLENKEFISNISKRRSNYNTNSNYVRNGCRVKSIKYIGKQNVYDICNVEDNKNFIANGFVVSNTGKSSAAIMLARQWCRLLGLKFNPARHIAYNNADVTRKIDMLNHFEPIICDEAIRFASSADWAKKENKVLKKKLAQVRTKHLLYILCFPLKIYKLEKTYLESFVNYWIDLFARGVGACYVKDKNPVQDSWRMKEFQRIGSYTEFTATSKIEQKLKKHPNFWQLIKFPKPPEWLYNRYLYVREKNVYDDENVLGSVSKEDIHNALLILALRDIMMHDTTLTMNRIILHIKNEYDISIGKGMVQRAVEDAKQLVIKIREQAIKV